MFVDDLLFFGEHSRVNVNNLRKFFEEYTNLSSQQINYSKSSIHFSKGISDIRKETSCQDMGVREMNVEDKYMGIYPLKYDYRISSYDFLKNKFNSRYSDWRQHHTNHAGRTVLCKSTLNSIPTFFMGFCLLPKGVTNHIDKVSKKFFWGHSADERKMHFFNWEKYGLQKEFGGLGIHNAEMINKSLICKLVWRFLDEEDAMWTQLLLAKYLKDSTYWTIVLNPKNSAIWNSMLEVRPILENRIFWQV